MSNSFDHPAQCIVHDHPLYNSQRLPLHLEGLPINSSRGNSMESFLSNSSVAGGTGSVSAFFDLLCPSSCLEVDPVGNVSCKASRSELDCASGIGGKYFDIRNLKASSFLGL